jgi:hypothetical protein
VSHKTHKEHAMGRTSLKDLTVRKMRTDEIAVAINWAAAEGWNPGLDDARCFATADPQGFLIGELDGKPAAVISTVNHDDRFSFLGLYIVRPDLRGCGYGLRLWQAGLAHAGNRSIGLDGVVAQQDNYRKSGFAYAHRNIRYGGVPQTLGAKADKVPLSQVPFDKIVADDARVFPAARPKFWQAWLNAPGHRGEALVRDGDLAAWGVIRPCRKGRRIGPLIAADIAAAEVVFEALVGEDQSEVFIDTPEPTAPAVALAEARGLKPVFETARMYKGPVRSTDLNRVFGVATLELG